MTPFCIQQEPVLIYQLCQPSSLCALAILAGFQSIGVSLGIGKFVLEDGSQVTGLYVNLLYLRRQKNFHLFRLERIYCIVIEKFSPTVLPFQKTFLYSLLEITMLFI